MRSQKSHHGIKIVLIMGIDGSKNAVAFINSANKHLNKKGKIIFLLYLFQTKKK